MIMARTDRTGVLLLALSAFLALAPPSGGQEPKEPREKKEAARPKNRARSLTVVVADDSTGLPLAGATVFVRADDYEEQRLTTSDGRISFSFTTEGNSVTVRVTAPHMVPHQQTINLRGPERDHNITVLLKKSN